MKSTSENEKLDYQGLQDLAQSRNIKFVEAQGLEGKCGVRFRKGGQDWIAVNPDLSESDKMRTLGYLLENYSPESQSGGQASEADTVLYASLQC